MFKSLNKYAMKILDQNGLSEICILILQWIIQRRDYQDMPTQICLAYNNLGCVYRRMNQTQLAINAFENALSLIQQYDQLKMKTITHLNITALLSQMNLHEKALKEAKSAIQSGQQEFDSNSNQTIRYLAMAHYNYGFELESLDRLKEAVKQYKRSLQFVVEHLGNQDPLFKKIYNGHQQAKQKLIVHMNEQSPVLFKKVLSLKKHFDVLTDESFQQTTPQQSPLSQTRKLIQRKKINFIENETVKKDHTSSILRRKTDQERQDTNRDKVQDIKAKLLALNVISSTKPKLKTQIEKIEIDQWSNSEHSDQEVKQQRSTERSPYNRGSILLRNSAKDLRLSFLNKQSPQRIYFDNSLIEKEKQIIREVEEQIYNTDQITKIQAQIRMKKERKNFYNLKKAFKDKGKLLKSDELKLKKLQRFIKKKVQEMKFREIKAKLIQQSRLKQYYQKQQKAMSKIVTYLLKYKASQQRRLQQYLIKAKQFQTIRQGFCNPIIKEGIQTEEPYVFTFSIMNDNSFVRFALVNAMKEKRKENYLYLEMDIESFLKTLGLLFQYCEELESLIVEENKLLRNIRNLVTLTQQFLYLNEVDGKYIVRAKTETNKQFIVQIEKIGAILQELVLIENNKIIIQGINNFDYTDVVPQYELIRVMKPPLYNKQLTQYEEKAIKYIQSFVRGHLQRLRMSKWVNNKTKQICETYLIRTNKNQYLQIVKSRNIHSKVNYLYIINHETQGKSNDLEIHQVVFKQMGDVCSENIFEILNVDLVTPYIEYTDEALYWINREKEYSQRSARLWEQITKAKMCVIIIQRAVMRYLVRRRCQIRNAIEERLTKDPSKVIERMMLARRAMIYIGDKACLTTCFLDIEKTDPQSSLTGKSEYQSITITSKHLEHAFSIDTVLPYYQRLFQPLEISEITSVAQKMIEFSQIIKNKKGLDKVDCKSVEQTYNQFISLQNPDQQDDDTYRENTIQARQIISSTLTQKYLQQSTIINVEFPPMVIHHQLEEYKQMNFIKVLQSLFRLHKHRTNMKGKQSKYVEEYDETSIKTYVLNTLPCTEYGTNPTLFQETQLGQNSISDLQSENSPLFQKEFVGELIVEFNEAKFKLLILYLINEQTFSVQAENQITQKVSEISITITQLQEYYQIPDEYFKVNFSKLLLPCLSVIEDKLIFNIDEIQMQYIIDEYLKSQKDKSTKLERNQISAKNTDQAYKALHSDKVAIGNYQKGSTTISFEFQRAPMLLRIILLYQIGSEKRVIEVDSNEFQSKYINDNLQNLSNLRVINFFKGFAQALTKVLIINEIQYTHNFEELRPGISLLLREKFVLKIQGMLLVKRMVEKFKIYKQLKRSKLFLQKFILNHYSNYVEIDYFLIKHNYHLQLTMRELSFITHKGRVIEKGKIEQNKRRFREKQFIINLVGLQQEKEILYQSLHKRQDQIDFQRIDFAQLQSYDKMKTIEYYRALINPLIQLIQKNLHINFIKFQFQLEIPIAFTEKNIQKKRKRRIKNESKYQIFIVCILTAQAAFRKKLFKDWIHLKVLRNRQLQEKNRYFTGKFVMRTFKLIQEDHIQNYYIINVYKQDGKIEDQIQLTFELIPVQKQNRQNKLKTTCFYDNSQLISFGQQNLYEFFINKIKIEEKIIKFDENKFLQVDENYKFNQSQLINQKDEEVPQDNGRLITKDQQEILIDQDRTNDAIVNIVYTNSKNTINKKQEEDIQDDVTKLQIDLQEVKKLYPNFNFNNPNTMKILSSNLLIKGVKVEQNSGNLLIDKSRIQSSFINPTNLSKNKQESQQNIPEFFKKVRLTQRPHSNNVLSKRTFYSQGKKHLIVISYVRKKINKLLLQDRDCVFDDHHRIFEIKAQVLDLKERIQPIFWFLTPDDAQIITHQSTIENIANILIQQIQIANNKFIYLCFDYQDQQLIKLKYEGNVVFFVENSIKPMQEKFRNRILKNHYNIYRGTLEQAKKDGSLILHKVGNLNTLKRLFIILFIEGKEALIFFKIYDVSDQMQEFGTEISIKKYMSIYLQDKTKCLEVLLNFIEFKIEINKILFLHPKPDIVEEYLLKQRQLSYHSSSESVRRSIMQNPEGMDSQQNSDKKMLKQLEGFQSINLIKS
ncbi:unnamed protein product (macronuclear) [Paramecium tetraurelia]|uniref:Uncharacterized protein n=1 Tax=Paramecium tetraurelia TaxID=5888 RepID=A0E9I3_PARTE|nr:uncharacterized protein GSPATT00024681001 [Paramecium tetraurelia]CAK91950.1 unnamed protein product [Paramecium tetraurelia]|eukprot:XP_001459347.1 hypothetical protein (macronuclear) [Paramecium tetraurelia strain d4-2]